MEDKETLELQEVEALDPKVQAAIEKKVAELKENNPKARIIPLMVEGEGSDENQASAMRQLAKDCFLDGDRELIDDDSLFLFGLMGQLQHLIKMRGGRVINLSKPGK